MEIWLIVFVVFILFAFSVLIIASITRNLMKRINPPPTPSTSSQVQVIYSSSFQTRVPFHSSTNNAEINHQIAINDNLPPPPYHSLDFNQSITVT